MRTTQKVPKSVRCMLKYDLKHYPDYLEELKRTEDISSPRYNHIKVATDGITKVYKTLPAKTAKLITAAYVSDKVSVEAAADILGITKTDAYTMIAGAMISFATELGYIKPKE